MGFLFQCPHCANVLQADPSEAGRQCTCPICHALFIVPAPVLPKARPVRPVPGSVSSPGAVDSKISFPTGATGLPTPPHSQNDPQSPGQGAQAAAAEPPPLATRDTWRPSPSDQRPQTGFQVEGTDTLHIPCPECRTVLETPVEMLHQDVVCPHCDAPFCLHLRDSLEYRRKKAQQQKIKERRISYAWLTWAIVAAVLVAALLVYLVASTPSD